MAARDDAGEPMSDREVRDNVTTMFTAANAAGRASAMVWALHLLDGKPPPRAPCSPASTRCWSPCPRR
ncbi:hypothetical protein OHA17_21090 [Streptomyces sp. NBC_00212]